MNEWITLIFYIRIYLFRHTNTHERQKSDNNNHCVLCTREKKKHIHLIFYYSDYIDFHFKNFSYFIPVCASSILAYIWYRFCVQPADSDIYGSIVCVCGRYMSLTYNEHRNQPTRKSMEKIVEKLYKFFFILMNNIKLRHETVMHELCVPILDVYGNIFALLYVYMYKK